MIDYGKFFRKEKTRAVLTNQPVRIPIMEKVFVKDEKIVGETKSGVRFMIMDYGKGT